MNRMRLLAPFEARLHGLDQPARKRREPALNASPRCACPRHRSWGVSVVDAPRAAEAGGIFQPAHSRSFRARAWPSRAGRQRRKVWRASPRRRARDNAASRPACRPARAPHPRRSAAGCAPGANTAERAPTTTLASPVASASQPSSRSPSLKWLCQTTTGARARWPPGGCAGARPSAA